MSIAERKTYVVVDELGMDPLRDDSYDAILSIVDFTRYTVTESDKFNAPLIASIAYQNADLWWTILVYNGLPDQFTLKEGTQIKLPLINELTSALSQVEPKATTKTVAI